MSQFLIPLAAAVLIVLYWVSCRRRSLAYREKAVGILTDFFEKKSVDEVDKDVAEHFYLGARHWIFMPMMTLLSIPLILVRPLSKEPENQLGKDRSAVIDVIMKMYLLRYPLTATVCLAAFFVAVLISQFIGLLTNRVLSIPTPANIYAKAAQRGHSLRRHAH